MRSIRCISIDMRGFGFSEGPSEVSCIRDLSEDIFKHLQSILSLEDIKKVSPPYNKKVIPVGWSLGGCVCQQLVIDHSDLLSRLILVASAGVHGHKLMKEDQVSGNLFLVRKPPQCSARIKRGDGAPLEDSNQHSAAQ